MTRTGRRWMAVAWPSFLLAGVLEMLVFAFVDPQALQGGAGGALGWTPMAVYTVSFVVFWAVLAACAAITLVLDASPTEVNSRSFR